MNLEYVNEPSLPAEGRSAREELNKFYRHEDLKKHLHKLIKIGIYTAFLAFVIVFVVRLTHLIIPICYHWLSEEQIQSIDKIFFSGALGGVIGGYLKNKFDGY